MQTDLLEDLIRGPIRYAGLRAPWGDPVWVAADDDAIVRVSPGCKEEHFLQEMASSPGRRPDRRPQYELLRAAILQLGEYFAGQRREFRLPVKLAGTPFQLRVWRALDRIPYGETWSYGELARAAGARRGARAVGQACGANPVAIVVPCHRVIRGDGSLGGYGGGLRFKQFLLDLERRFSEAHLPHPSEQRLR